MFLNYVRVIASSSKLCRCLSKLTTGMRRHSHFKEQLCRFVISRISCLVKRLPSCFVSSSCKFRSELVEQNDRFRIASSSCNMHRRAPISIWQSYIRSNKKQRFNCRQIASENSQMKACSTRTIAIFEQLWLFASDRSSFNFIFLVDEIINIYLIAFKSLFLVARCNGVSGPAANNA